MLTWSILRSVKLRVEVQHWILWIAAIFVGALVGYLEQQSATTLLAAIQSPQALWSMVRDAGIVGFFAVAGQIQKEIVAWRDSQAPKPPAIPPGPVMGLAMVFAAAIGVALDACSAAQVQRDEKWATVVLSGVQGACASVQDGPDGGTLMLVCREDSVLRAEIADGGFAAINPVLAAQTVSEIVHESRTWPDASLDR